MSQQTPLPSHRGLTWVDLPGRSTAMKRERFALFKRGMWPPANCRLPASATDEEAKSIINNYAQKFAAEARDGHARAGRNIRQPSTK